MNLTNLLINLLLPIVYMISTAGGAFLTIYLMIKLSNFRSSSKEKRTKHKEQTKIIKEGNWTRDFEHKITSETKAEIDKIILETYKKLSKIEIKKQRKQLKLKGEEVSNDLQVINNNSNISFDLNSDVGISDHSSQSEEAKTEKREASENIERD